MRLILLPEGPTPWLKPLMATHPGPWKTVVPPRLLRRAWMRAAGADAPTRIQARLAWRKAAGAWAAHALPAGAEVVYAPSFAARRLFSAAQAQGARTCLMEDLPDLRRLGVELDQASAAHPRATLLRRHRASAADLATQQAERELADRLYVPNPDRIQAERPCQPFPSAGGPGLRQPRVTSSSPRILLSGVPVARSGTHEALLAVNALPHITLLIRPSERTEPAELLEHPRVRLATPEELRLEGVDAVIAPSWVQSDHPLLDDALARGLVVVATKRAAGWRTLAPGAALSQPDGKALVQALADSL